MATLRVVEHAEARGTARGGSYVCTSSAFASPLFGVVVSMVTAGVSSSKRSINCPRARAAGVVACISRLPSAGVAGAMQKGGGRPFTTTRRAPIMLTICKTSYMSGNAVTLHTNTHTQTHTHTAPGGFPRVSRGRRGLGLTSTKALRSEAALVVLGGGQLGLEGVEAGVAPVGP
eukprot:scaffold42303_cov71-Phaeocystis_antarctica.AAC.3